MQLLHVLTIGISAFLLFSVQPMMAKIILPLFGGGSSIWLSSLIFFQTLLLAGYAFIHLLVRSKDPVKMTIAYALLVLVSAAFIPLQPRLTQAALPPGLHIFLLLAATLGPPYFVLSTTTPAVQYLMVTGSQAATVNPYVQYAVSNVGSLAGLLLYPVLIEPLLPNSRQTALWSMGYGIYTLLMLGCIAAFVRRRPLPVSDASARATASLPPPVVVSRRQQAGWIGRSMIPAIALVVFTHHLTVDIVNFPLLWVIPLSLYLISFVVCFSVPAVSRPRPWRTLACLAPVAASLVAARGRYAVPFAWEIVLSSVCLFAICMYFHGNLERDKPDPRHLTNFYLCVALGGCMGSLCAVVIAPAVFKSAFEFYLVLILTAYFMLAHVLNASAKSLKRLLVLTTAVILVLAFYNEEVSLHGGVAYRGRSFYGTYTVRDIVDTTGRHPSARLLNQGTTTHGGQTRDARHHLVPKFYFHEGTGAGSVLGRLDHLDRVAVVGLGTGVMALYGRKGQRLDFFEIDAAVVDIARQYFENLAASRADVHFVTGDARLALERLPAGTYDLIILDAFNSDAVPTHLVTVEAVQSYLRLLRPDGLILFNISNRYLDLLPVLNCAAERLNLHIRNHASVGDWSTLRYPARWVALTPSTGRLAQLTASDDKWRTPFADKICWTDDFTHIWSAVRLR
jgi:SAM-dependent methyltransferase